MSPDDLAAIRERDRAYFEDQYPDPEDVGRQKAKDRRALLAHIDAITEGWEDAKRTKQSVMHDVGGVIEVVDELLGGTPQR